MILIPSPWQSGRRYRLDLMISPDQILTLRLFPFFWFESCWQWKWDVRCPDIQGSHYSSMWVDPDITRFVRHSGRRRLLLLPQGRCTMEDGFKVDAPVDVIRRSFSTQTFGCTQRHHLDNNGDGASYRADQSRLAWAIHDVGRVVVSACCPVPALH